MLLSTAEGISAPTGRASIAKLSKSAGTRPARAGNMILTKFPDASGGCGMASSQRAILRANSLW